VLLCALLAHMRLSPDPVGNFRQVYRCFSALAKFTLHNNHSKRSFHYTKFPPT
jgi:hypothetical protein